MSDLRNYLLMLFFACNVVSVLPTRLDKNIKLNDDDVVEIDRVEKTTISLPKYLWPNSTVYYMIDPSLENYTCFIEEQMTELMSISEYCISFVNSKGIGNYLDIKLDSKCTSSYYIGMVGGKQNFGLNKDCLDSGSILHNLMHALGFVNEQQRSDRDQYVDVIKDNIESDLTFVFDKIEPRYILLLTSYDYESIMHDASNAYTKNGKNTIVPKIAGMKLEGYREKTTISKSDLIELKYLYSCLGYTPIQLPDVNCTFQTGKCVFTEDSKGFQSLKRVAEKDNYVMLAEGKGKFALQSDIMFWQQGKVCLSFMYQVESAQAMISHFMEIESNDYHHKELLQRSKTSGWKTVQFELEPKSHFEVHVQIESKESITVKYDDFRFAYNPCPE